MKTSRVIPAAVRRNLGHYVYLYVNPISEAIFYVGKGVSKRALAHIGPSANSDVRQEIRAIQSAGRQPRIEILAHSLKDAGTALALESAAISVLGLNNLANAVKGHNSRLSRFAIEDLVAHYSVKKVRIKEPSLLIRVNKLFRPGMSDVDLYDITRSAWKVGSIRDKVRLILPVYEGVIREVYRPATWLPAGSTFNPRYDGRVFKRAGRWEFVGVIAEEKVRRKYRGGFVGNDFPRGSQNPIKYLNV